VEGLRLAWGPVPPGRIARREAAWALLRTLLAEAGAPEVVLTNPCPRCGGAHGPVQLRGAPWWAAVTYAGATAVVGILPRDAADGFALDAEPLHDPVREAAGGIPGGLRRWVRAEAALKADGRGLAVDAASVAIAGDDGDRWVARLPGTARVVHGAEVEGPPGVLVCAAVLTDAEGVAAGA